MVVGTSKALRETLIKLKSRLSKSFIGGSIPSTPALIEFIIYLRK